MRNASVVLLGVLLIWVWSQGEPMVEAVPASVRRDLPGDFSLPPGPGVGFLGLWAFTLGS